MVAVGIVELGRAEADLDVGDAGVIGCAADEGAVLGADADGRGVANGVAEEVGRELFVVRNGSAVAKGGEGALQLGGHRVQ
jgi:hypothetical protein